MHDRELLQVAQRAATLAERIERARDAHFMPDAAAVQARLEAWCQAVSKGDWEAFGRRLAWDGLDLEAARRALDPRSAESTELPAWTNTLAEALASENQAEGGDRPDLLDPEHPIPFEEVLAPFVHLARRRLAARVGAHHRLFSDEAHAALARGLLHSLSRAAAQALQLEFSIVRSREQSSFDRLLALALDDDEPTLYRQFVDRLLNGGLLPFFQEYPVLARLLATAVDLWVEANAELLERLGADLPELRRRFGGGDDLGQVVAPRPGLSDPHRGRRSVAALTFASGRQLIYKPKSLEIEAAYNRLLAWLNERGAPLPFRVVEVLDRGDHGWVEYVEHRPCDDREQARRYFRRAGMLLALVHLLEGTDCHAENIIASGEHPVLIDLETLLQHRVPDEEGDEGMQAQLLASGQLARSVLRTGLLPVWQVAADGRGVYDVSGLGSLAAQDIPTSMPTWSRVNTDRMALEPQPTTQRQMANVPLLDGVGLRLDDHADELMDGFRQMYRFLLAQRAALLEPDSPLHALADQRVRFVYRPTKVYGVILVNLFQPRYLRDGADRGIQLEQLARAYVQSAERSPLWSVLAVEQRSMEQLDIPFFAARSGGDSLEIAPGRTIPHSFREPSFDLVLARLRDLSEADLELQVAFVEGSLFAHLAGDVAVSSAADATGWDGAAAPDADRLVAQAVAIAEQMRARAIRAGDGSATWIAPQYLAQSERFRLQPVTYDLYNGSSGIALFLAALAETTGGDDYRELALAALKPLRHELSARGERLADHIGIGGAVGLGSLAYGLTRASRFLDEPALLDDAARAAALITPERIAADSHLDVIGGAAGAILGLLSLYEVRADRTVLELAGACGQRLLEARTPSPDGPHAWPVLDDRLLTGFSHGAAGISYALLRLHAATGEYSFREAAEEGIAYERSLFSPKAGNWPDLRRDGEPTFATQWCHGATGIGLARLGGLAALDGDEIRQEIETALQATQRVGIQALDQLCCGNLGRADLLLTAADRLARPALRDQAAGWAGAVVGRAEREGGFLLHPLLPRAVYNPALFQGIAGVGYELLRLARPDLPSVLLWE